MLKAAICAAALMVAPSVYALECGSDESPDILTVTDWEAELVDSQMGDVVRLSVTLESGAAEAFRMIDASVRFYDILGQQIAGHLVERDMNLAPGDVFADESLALGGRYRLTHINREDVEVIACTESVVYDDGTVERFGE